jgi:hypothetical protein
VFPFPSSSGAIQGYSKSQEERTFSHRRKVSLAAPRIIGQPTELLGKMELLGKAPRLQKPSAVLPDFACLSLHCKNHAGQQASQIAALSWVWSELA